MASNRSRIRGRQLACVVTDGGVAAGDPCLVGQMGGVSMNGNAGNSALPQVIDFLGVYALNVQGITTGGGAGAVNEGDIIYYVPGNSPKLSKASDGTGAVRFGYAVRDTGQANPLVASGNAGTTILVRLGY